MTWNACSKLSIGTRVDWERLSGPGSIDGSSCSPVTGQVGDGSAPGTSRPVDQPTSAYPLEPCPRCDGKGQLLDGTRCATC